MIGLWLNVLPVGWVLFIVVHMRDDESCVVKVIKVPSRTTLLEHKLTLRSLLKVTKYED